MKKHSLVHLLLLTGIITLTSAYNVYAFEQPQGEKLISFSIDNDKWEINNKDTLQSKTLVWWRKALRKEGRPFDDFYSVTIYNKTTSSLNDIRNRNDEPGRRFCGDFKSIDLQDKTNGNYSSKLWHTHCVKRKEPEARIVHMVLKGENHVYHIQKGWRGKIDEALVDVWIERIKPSYLCDINSDTAPCLADKTELTTKIIERETPTTMTDTESKTQ